MMPTFLSFRFMVAFGGLFIFVAAWAWWRRKDIAGDKYLAKILPWMIPVPYVAIMAGWTVAEVGRQPWIVYNLMRTSDAVSPVPSSSVLISFLAFLGIYTLLGVVDIWLLRKFARKGPEPVKPAEEA